MLGGSVPRISRVNHHAPYVTHRLVNPVIRETVTQPCIDCFFVGEKPVELTDRHCLLREPGPAVGLLLVGLVQRFGIQSRLELLLRLASL